MRFLSLVVGIVAMFASGMIEGEPLPDSTELAKSLAPYLATPLPSIESLVGVAMPPPSPLMVVASLGDDASQPDLDRGYAVGFTLNDLLFDADPKLDVVAPWRYADDTRKKDAPRGQKRDSAANAYRAAVRDHANWCVHGRVSGAKTVLVDVTVDGCTSGVSSHRRQWKIASEADWPGALAEMCEFASASATDELTSIAHASCHRARSIRPGSLLALARYGGPRENRAWKTLEAMVAADPAFAPAAIDYLARILYDGKRRDEFGERVGVIAKGAPQSSAVQLAAHWRVAYYLGWNVRQRPYPEFFAWIRNHAYLSAAWLAVASGLAQGSLEDWPDETWWTRLLSGDIANWVSLHRARPPNEATHTASLALSLAIYQRWPQAYRTHWQMAFALQQYGWMLRGPGYWHEVPKIGRRGFPVFIDLSEQFYQSTLSMNPDANEALIGLMISTKLNGGDWLAAFDRAVEANPHNWWLYDRAMCYARPQWGGDAETRLRIESVALENNPDAAWAKTLRSRWESSDKSKNE
jgi:hypothetical protein